MSSRPFKINYLPADTDVRGEYCVKKFVGFRVFFFLTPIKIRFFDIKIMFYKYRSSRAKFFCNNDVFKRVKMMF